MKTLPSALTPFVRSDTVGAILAETMLTPDQEFTLAELSRRTGGSAPTVHREVSKLVENTILQERTEGRNRLVKANPEHPLYLPMAEIIRSTYGPEPTLRDLLTDTQGVHHAYIYGSWASRREGEPGNFPQDLDVLIVGDISRRQLAIINEKFGRNLAIPLNISRISQEEWESPSPSVFVSTVKSRPLRQIV